MSEKPVQHDSVEETDTTMSPEENHMPQVSEKKDMKKTSLGVMFGGGIIVVLILALLGGYFFVKSQVKAVSENPTVITWAEVFNIPVATVNGESIAYVEYIDNKQTLEKFYQNAPEGFPPVTDEQLSEMTISRLVANTLVRQIADDLDIEVTDDDIEGKKQELLQNFPSEDDARAQIEETYGWTFEQYIDEVIRPLVLEEKLSEAVRSGGVAVDDEYNSEEVKARHILFRVQEDEDADVVRQQAQEVLEQVKQGGDFEALAKEFGGDGTAENGGDLGWFGPGVMVPEFEQAALQLEAGQVAEELIQTEFGFHIIKVDERRSAQDFTSFMEAKLREASIEMKAGIANPFDQAAAESV